MSIQNLAIVFGPTLFGQISSNGSISGHGNGSMVDAAFQNKVGMHTFVFLSVYFYFLGAHIYFLKGYRDNFGTLHRYICGRLRRRDISFPRHALLPRVTSFFFFFFDPFDVDCYPAS